jgi:outer membrane lipoprotein-sorting protein
MLVEFTKEALMPKSILTALAIAAASIGATTVAIAQTTTPRVVQGTAATELTGTERTAVLGRASAALNAFRMAQGRFTQTAPNGARTNGGFWLQRPGKVRFEYDAPSPLLIVANGTTVAIQDRSLRTTDRVPLNTTPLQFILKSQTNLEADARVTRVARIGDTTRISLRDRSGRTEGELTLIFNGAAMTLTQWIVTDGSGGTTTVALSGITQPGRIDPRQFILPDTADPTRRGGRR